MRCSRRCDVLKLTFRLDWNLNEIKPLDNGHGHEDEDDKNDVAKLSLLYSLFASLPNTSANKCKKTMNNNSNKYKNLFTLTLNVSTKQPTAAATTTTSRIVIQYNNKNKLNLHKHFSERVKEKNKLIFILRIEDATSQGMSIQKQKYQDKVLSLTCSSKNT
ncbi:hypothetical protein FF38_13474 [Lucilia cuprina]|uniref:Uncharacterized protein n=1 Tax=Lucilia cuprina TaxID=7375 RepID=A0A0L0BR98_LUCCU|nr:hypothetical protein FF38_13474 [Lucilia cuprina]